MILTPQANYSISQRIGLRGQLALRSARTEVSSPVSGERLTNSDRAGYGHREGLQPHMLSQNMPVPLVLPTCSKTGLSLPVLVSFVSQESISKGTHSFSRPASHEHSAPSIRVPF